MMNGQRVEDFSTKLLGNFMFQMCVNILFLSTTTLMMIFLVQGLILGEHECTNE